MNSGVIASDKMKKPHTDETRKYGSLNDAARANLDIGSLRKFFNIQDDLESEGVPWDDAEDILRGFIWAEIGD